MGQATDKPAIVILGAGPAGLALAVQLLRRSEIDARVIVLEREERVGGIAVSFEHEGIHLDYGSHRLHPATDPRIMNDIRALLNEDLLKRPRNGRIRLLGRFVKFPLNPMDLALHLPPSFILGILRDSLMKPFRKKTEPKSFADAVMAGLGPTVCENFYFPYAQKLWGLDPREIAVEQAQKRVSANSILKVVRKALSVIPGLKPPGAGIFYYPRKGFGQICDALAAEVARLGGEVRVSTAASAVRIENGRAVAVVTDAAPDEAIRADFVFSTINIISLVKMLTPSVPEEVITSADRLRNQGMVFFYAVLNQQQFSPYDAHYFPGKELIFSRLSEPKNYSATTQPEGKTVLCFEIPCLVDGKTWKATDDELRQTVFADMAAMGLPVEHVDHVFTRRHTHVYPVYTQEYAPDFDRLDGCITAMAGLTSLGRQGLFAHDNTHHTMEMAYRAAECLRPDMSWDNQTWQTHREEFAAHVVED
ncbi:MAG: FAD-dependent oxidoreductase [Spartobacteria bacterium]|nr:FAD-dependent oxidoreductase [Spartobacteria bacterium]